MPDFAMDSWQVVVFLIVTAALAGTIRGITGFGGPAIMLLSLTQLFSPTSILHLVVSADYAANVQLVVGAMKEALWRSMLPLLLASLCGVSVGLTLLTIIDPTWIKRAIAIVVGVCSVIMLSGWRYHLQPSWWIAVAIGLIGGTIVGLTYIALPVMIYLFAGPALAAVARANALVWGFLTSSLMIAVLSYQGLFGLQDIKAILVVCFSYMAGAHLGAKVFRRFSEKAFRRLVLWLLIALSVLGLAN